VVEMVKLAAHTDDVLSLPEIFKHTTIL
jgi:hypothetical protein